MKLNFVRVSPYLPEYEDIRELYLTAFPAEERAPFSVLMSRRKRPDVDFWAVYTDHQWAGMAYVISRNDISYLFYLAVAGHRRGQGIGSRIIRCLQKLYAGQRFFLALEMKDSSAPNYADRLRRSEFYRRNGLVYMDCRIREADVIYDVMGTGGTILPEEYEPMMKEYIGFPMNRLVKMQILPKEDK